MSDIATAIQSAETEAGMHQFESGRLYTSWTCEKWEEDAVDFARREIEAEGKAKWYDAATKEWRPLSDGLPSEVLRRLAGEPDDVVVVPANLLLNEGIQRLLDLLIGAGGAAYNNAGTYIGVGTSATAAAATQTELQGTADSSNRFYKVMVATYPIRTLQSVDFRSDFVSSEANFIWNEWSVSAGATTASGGGFLVGTTNLNRKVESLGTKATGTWTLTGTITIA